MSSNPYEPPASPPSTLPLVSEASVKNGAWFVFPMQGYTIRVWGSLLTGIERVYVDDQIVSEHRSLGKLSEHRFSRNGEDFLATYTTVSLLRGPLECRLFRGGTLVGALRASFKSQWSYSHDDFLRLIVFIVGGALVGLLVAVFKWPLWWSVAATMAVIFALSLAQRSKKTEGGGITIEEIPSEPQKPVTTDGG